MRSARLMTAVVGFLTWMLVAGQAGLVSAGEAPAPGKAEPWRGELAVNASQQGAPISPLIYGQFIEHLGRCIYGGIWAEMLEDRKFFYPVGDKDSPWKAFSETKVVMDRDKPFGGQHTPRIVPSAPEKGAGIVQGGLALRKGHRYVGRIWLASAAEPGETPKGVTVRISWAPELSPGRTFMLGLPASREFQEYPLSFTAGADTDDGRLRIGSLGTFRVGAVSLMPADNVHGMRADTLALLKQLDAPIYRWPGGNFVSGYNWKDAIGDPDRRPTRKNPAWKGIEHHDFGIDEFMQFCREIKTEPYMVVNSGQGDVRLAADMVEYANGSADTPMGKLRAKNGHPEPYGVRWWSIGNEMYGNWQLGHMPLEKYLEKHNQFAKAMRAVDPSIKIVAVGAVGPWTVGMMNHCAGAMDAISEHFYVGAKPDLVAHVRQMTDSVHRIAEAHRKYRKEIPALAGKQIPIALDEWNYWYGPDLYGEIGTRYFLKDALGVAAALHEYARQSDIYVMANYAQTVNVIGAIKTSKTAAEFETTGLVLKLYRHRFGTRPVATKVAAPLDAMAALGADGKTLTVGMVNPTMHPLEVPLKLEGVKITGEGRKFEIAGKDPLLFNEPGKPPRVCIVETPVTGLAGRLPLAPCSVTLYALAVE